MGEPTDLELSVLRTICWFSVFEYPITSFEIWKWLIKPLKSYNLCEIEQVLEKSDWLLKCLEKKNGFYILRNVSKEKDLLTVRHERFLNAIVKYRKLRHACYYFQILPGVRAVIAVNTLAWWHTTSHSDIDLYIVTEKNRIWSTRLLMVLPFMIAGNRPQHNHDYEISDPFCFSFFSTIEALQMESLKLDNNDLYLAFWIKSLVPMFERACTFSDIGLENSWSDTYLPNAVSRGIHPLHKTKRMISIPLQCGFFEPICRAIQRNRFPSTIKALANIDSRVIVSNQMLKFHENDRRAQFMRQYTQTLEHYL